MVKERTSAAVRRSASSSVTIHLRRRVGIRARSVVWPMRAARTAAQASGRTASSSRGSSTGCSTPSTPATAAMPTALVSTSTVWLTTHCAVIMPRTRARCSASWNSGSSKPASGTWLVRPYRRCSAIRSTCGRSRACAQPAPACRPARSAPATPTRISAGSAARTRSGVGPWANSASSTPVVASRPKAVNTPPSRLSPIVITVSRGLACQAIRTAWATRAGSRLATVRKPTSASFAPWAYQSGSLSSPRSGASVATGAGEAAVIAPV